METYVVEKSLVIEELIKLGIPHFQPAHLMRVGEIVFYDRSRNTLAVSSGTTFKIPPSQIDVLVEQGYLLQV